jgi:hypothetical protein
VNTEKVIHDFFRESRRKILMQEHGFARFFAAHTCLIGKWQAIRGLHVDQKMPSSADSWSKIGAKFRYFVFINNVVGIFQVRPIINFTQS